VSVTRVTYTAASECYIQQLLVSTEEQTMIDPSNPKIAADDLTKTAAGGDVELTEQELRRVVGGKANGSLEAGLHFKYDIKGNKEG
jgi:hypothetical protein